jgi:hypothetical protein
VAANHKDVLNSELRRSVPYLQHTRVSFGIDDVLKVVIHLHFDLQISRLWQYLKLEDFILSNQLLGDFADLVPVFGLEWHLALELSQQIPRHLFDCNLAHALWCDLQDHFTRAFAGDEVVFGLAFKVSVL